MKSCPARLIIFETANSLYKALNGQDEIRAKALLILMLRNWLTEVSNFDPVSGHALHTGIVEFMELVANSMKEQEALEGETKDRIYRIASHTMDAVLAIMKQSRDKILREHAMLPLYAARELDSNSVQWLSRRPGRTIREKLSGKPYLKAVRRRHSVDTAENRLLKAFLVRLEQILFERQNALNSTTEENICEELLVSIGRWRRSDDAAEIGAWGNLPPNNTLLQDKRYRKVWDGWLWLQGIDEHILTDSKRVHQDILRVVYWNTLSLLNQSGRFRTVQQPIGIDYDSFSISPELSVRGYLFPTCDSKIMGKIKNINYEKKFGFLTSENGADLFFHKNNLSVKLDINSLSAGDEVSFAIGRNRQGECADDITLTLGIIPVDFSLLGDKLEIQVGGSKYSLQINSVHLIIQQAQSTIKKLKIEPTAFKEIPKAIFSLVTGSPFEYSEPENNQSDLIRMNSSVVDLCSIRPRFTNHTGSQTHLPFRLLNQIWPLKDGATQVVDCGDTQAIALNADIETVSMRSLFLENSTHSDAAKSSASMFFAKKLSKTVGTDRLTYLVPDWGNDFDLESIRKSINFYFEDSAPLPKSIATIFAWQSLKKFVQNKVLENDFVLVVDSFDGGISITPIQAIYQKELDAILPETHGISWERHPTIIIPNKNIHTAIARNLTKDGCQASEEVIQLFGIDGLASDAGKVSFVKDENWYHLSESIEKILLNKQPFLSDSDVIKCLKHLNKPKSHKSKILILPINNSVNCSKIKGDYFLLESSPSLVEGGSTLNLWTDTIAKSDVNLALWRDHLPELSVRIVRNGHFENFYLVKDATVTPQRGRTVDIRVEETFTLPAGQMHYSFPLQQGKGNKELQFAAYLKSPAFPLEENTICRLKMTYTYGADDPYELKFIPLDSEKAGFKSVRVEWRSASESTISDLENLPVPDFPARKSWSDFQKFPKEDGKSFSDLLDWVERKLEMLDRVSDSSIQKQFEREICKYDAKIDGLMKHRVVGKFVFGKYDKNGDYFCFVEVDGERVFCHSSRFLEKIDEQVLSPDEHLYLSVVKGREGKLSGRDISLQNIMPECIQKKIDKLELNRSEMTKSEFVVIESERVKKAIFSLRFPALTIWNHGHSLSELDVPDHFRNSIFEGTQKILSIIGSENMPNILKEELFFFLCCLHKDAPDIVGTRLLDAVKDKRLLRRYHKNIAFAISNAELPYQQELLENVIDPIDNEDLTRSITMEILSIAFWRSKTLLLTLTKDVLRTLNRNLYRCLRFDFEKVAKSGKGYQIVTLCKHLELLLALLRSRGSKSEGFKTILSPDKELTQKYVTLVDDVSRIVIDGDIELKSRISLQLNKPPQFCNTPDLLYALRMYLTGDSGANTIVITSVVDE